MKNNKKSKKEVKDGTNVTAEVLIKLRDLSNSFSQANDRGDTTCCPDLNSVGDGDKADKEETGCSAEVCVNKHNPVYLLKVMDIESSSKKIEMEAGSSPKDKV